ncbi:MAG: hypothetical protein ABEI39_05645 [Halobacteriales archaeon]
MKSGPHAAISLVAGLAALAVTTPTVPAWVVVAVAVVAGVGIDLDHFLLARYNTGDWTALQRCLRDPTIVFLDQEAIFERGDVGALKRLLTHLVIAGLVVPVLYLWRPYVAGVVALSLYAHVLADVVAGVSNRVVVDREELPDDWSRGTATGDAPTGD